MKILLVDESKFFLTIEAQMLKKTPCELLEAGSVEEMLTLCRKQLPQLIYLAVNLTGVDGIEGCRLLKADPRLNAIPVVLICEPDDPEQLAAAQATGSDAVLVKPLDRIQMLEVGSRFIATIREPRRACLFEVSYLWGELQLRGKCLDLNRGGLFLQGGEPVVSGDMLELEFSLPDDRQEAIRCQAQVTWINEREKPMKPHYPRGFGVKFMRIDPEAIVRVDAFLKG